MQAEVKRTYSFAGLFHHNFIVREGHEDELLHGPFLLTDHLTIEWVLCNGACTSNQSQPKMKQSALSVLTTVSALILLQVSTAGSALLALSEYCWVSLTQ